MPEDETIQNEEVVTEEVTNDQTQNEVVESGEQQNQVDPYAFPDNLKSRYKSAEELANFAATKQSEADRMKRELEIYKQQHPEAMQAQTNQPSPEAALEKLAADPVGFVRELTNDIRAQIALTDFASSHPKMREYKEDIANIINRTPGILADPDGLEMVYNHVARQREANQLNQAAAIKNAQNQQTLQTKKTDAYVETSTSPKKESKPIIDYDADMTVEEIDKALDEAGIGWLTDADKMTP